MTSKKSIDEFMAQKNIAIAGISRKKQKFGNTIYKELAKKGYNVFPLNPNIDLFEGNNCYKKISSLPEEVTGIVINTKPKITIDLIKEAELKGIKHIWLQQGSTDKDIIAYSQKSSSNIIYKECVIMFADPANGLHAFHKWLRKSFGKYPN